MRLQCQNIGKSKKELLKCRKSIAFFNVKYSIEFYHSTICIVMPVARGPKGRVDQLRQGLSENGRVSDSQLPRNTPRDELHRLTVYREQWHSLHV